MKKILVAATLGFIAHSGAQAQDFGNVKTQLVLTRYKEAKAEMDKILANPKFASKPEVWLMKANVYGAYAGAATKANLSKEDSAAYLNEATQALKKYTQLEPSSTLLMKDDYKAVPFPLYAAYFNVGIGQFNTKEWDGAFTNLKSAVNMSNYLIKSKAFPGPIDTNAVLYTGAAAQNAKKEEEAVIWYGKLADAKVGGKENEFLYQFTTDYYLRKKDEANFKKFEALGKELYPNSKYFNSVGVDFARSSSNFDDLIKFYETKSAANPTDYDLQYELGAEIFDHLSKDTTPKSSEDISKWEEKMIGVFTKASEIKTDKGLPLAVIGSYYAKKADKYNVKIDSVNAAMRAFNRGAKPDKLGKLPPVPKEMLAQKDELFKGYYATLDQAAVYYQQAAERFGKQATLEPQEKQFYKNAVSNMIDISEMKVKNAKGKPADIAKYTAEQKKWEGVFDSIK